MVYSGNENFYAEIVQNKGAQKFMKASTDYPVHELISTRWSPYSFDPRTVTDEDVRSLFEAVRWAASSYNEQPWSYVVATNKHPEEFQRLLSCLVEANQSWARTAPVLALAVTRLTFTRNGKPNRAAIHDLGLASANLVFEATARSLVVHQMIGILPDKARELYQIPEGHEPLTALAIGYAGDPGALPESMQERDLARRPRKPLQEILFSGKWNNSAWLLPGN
jgi:nitroreductase